MRNKTPKILVVDDIADWRVTIQKLLRDENYNVQMADSSSKAIELLEKNEKKQFDLAILDMRLDDSDDGNTEGLDLAETIQQRWPKVKVIILTGYSTPERQARAMVPDAQGQRLVADFIEKRESDMLVQSVRRLLTN